MLSSMWRTAASGEEAGCIFAIVIIVVAAAAVGAWYQRKAYNANLTDAARRFQGTAVTSFWSEPRIDLAVEGVSATVAFTGGKNSSAWTRLRFDWTPPGLLRIKPEGFFASIRKAFGAEDIETGDASFDSAFLVQGSPREWVLEVLNAEVRSALLRAANLGAGSFGGSGGTLEAGPSGVTLTRWKNLVGDRELLAGFMESGISLFSGLRHPASRDIKIVSAKESAAEGRCPVCDHPLESNVLHCGSCRTPHHADCWTYFGGCAIFACARRGGR